MRRYSETHEWVEEHNGLATVGLTQAGARYIGSITFIQLPQVGELFKAGDVAAVVESTKAAIDLCTPVSGQVVEVNESLKQNISLLVEKGEGAGWLFRIQLSAPSEFLTLLDEKRYHSLIKE